MKGNYMNNLVLEVTGVDKLIQDWDVNEGASGDITSFDLGYIRLSRTVDGIKEIGETIKKVIEENLCTDIEYADISDEGCVTVTLIENVRAEHVDDTKYTGKMYICDYIFNVRINGINVFEEDLISAMLEVGVKI